MSKKKINAILMPSSNQDFNDYCICQRYANDVFCENAACTFSGHGRIQRPCHFHPESTYLLDLTVCPYCQSKCVEIFIPSTVAKDKGSRREPQKEELMDCKATKIVPFISYDQQPYIKEQKMLTEIYSKKLPKEEYSLWKEMMQKRCFIIKKKYQLLVKQGSSSSSDAVPKITMADLEKMREDLYDASKVERNWRRSTSALKSADSPLLAKLQKPKEKSKNPTTLSKAQLRLVNISNELPKINPEKELPPSKVQQRLVNISNELPKINPEKELPSSKVQQRLVNISNELPKINPEKELPPSKVQQRLVNISNELPKINPEKELPSSKVQQRLVNISNELPKINPEKELPSSKVQQRLVNISNELPKINPEKELPSSKVQLFEHDEVKVERSQKDVYLPPHRRENPDTKDSWRRPVNDTSSSPRRLEKTLQAQSPSFKNITAFQDTSSSPRRLEKTLQAQSQSFDENMTAIQKSFEMQTLRAPQEKPPTAPQNRTPTTICYDDRGKPDTKDSRRRLVKDTSSSPQKLEITLQAQSQSFGENMTAIQDTSSSPRRLEKTMQAQSQSFKNMTAFQDTSSSPRRLEKTLQAQSQSFDENMTAIQKSFEMQTLRAPQEKPPTAPQNRTPTTICYDDREKPDTKDSRRRLVKDTSSSPHKLEKTLQAQSQSFEENMTAIQKSFEMQTLRAPQEKPPTAPQEKPPTAPQEKPPTAPQEKPPTAPQEKPPTAPQEKPPTAPQNSTPTTIYYGDPEARKQIENIVSSYPKSRKTDHADDEEDLEKLIELKKRKLSDD